MPGGMLVQADSARVAAAMYGASLLSLGPLACAGLAALCLRRASAGARTLAWQSTMLGLLLCVLGRLTPPHWTAWVLPSAIATPLVALGRVQVSTALSDMVRDGAGNGGWLAAMALLYAAGAAVVGVPLVVRLGRLRNLRRRALSANAWGGRWSHLIERARARVGMKHAPRVCLSGEVSTPATWGVCRPTVVLPHAAQAWSDLELELALAHEFSHAQYGDWLFGVIARLTCALFWFNPAVWWLSRHLAVDRELACDQRVLATGARASDYAELLARASSEAQERPVGTARGIFALQLAPRGVLRARLNAILTSRAEARPRVRHGVWAASLITLACMGPASAVRLAPTRAVLDTLVRDTQWQTRAFAVVGLAQRSDSIAVARAVAERDPSPRVRAWARHALDVSLTR